MPATPGSDILEALLDAGIVTAEQAASVEKDHKATGKTVEVLLVEKKFIDDEALAKTKAGVLGVPYVDLIGKEIPAAVMSLVPRQAAENAKAVAFERDGSAVGIAMVDPFDPSARQGIDFLSQNAGFTPRYYITSAASFASALKKFEVLGKEVAKALEVAKEKYVPEVKKEAKEEKIEEVIKGAPVSRIVSVIMRHAVEGNASDIHVEPFGGETRVRYRVDGVLRTSLTLPSYIHSSVVSRIKVLANLKLDETRIPQDGRITETIGNKVVDFRVSTMPLQDSEKVVMRILDTTKGVPTLEQLGFRKEYIETIKAEIRKPHGMMLITGPTGSGKSTTLFTVLNMRNDEGVNIATLEDPVEYTIKGVNHSQVRTELGYTFASGLRALLRQDPNIIMVGEIRDGETGELAVHAALTGHLIFSTLHTNDAMGVVPRLTDMGVEPFLLGAVLNLAVAQRLARRNCDRCKGPVHIAPEVEAGIRKELAEIPAVYSAHLDLKAPQLTFYKGKGCLRCGDTGYIGRVAVAELLVFNDEMRDLVSKGFPQEKARETARKHGMITLRQDGLLKALEGSTTLEEVMRISAE